VPSNHNPFAPVEGTEAKEEDEPADLEQSAELWNNESLP